MATKIIIKIIMILRLTQL